MLEVTGSAVGEHVQGQSLIPLMSGEITNWRDSLLIEFVSYEQPMPWLVDASYKIIRKGKYKYIHWVHHKNSDELYDLERDPYELSNVIGSEEMEKIVATLRKELGQLVSTATGL